MGLMDRDYWKEREAPQAHRPKPGTTETIAQLQRTLDAQKRQPMQKRVPLLTLALAAAFAAFAVAMYVWRH